MKKEKKKVGNAAAASAATVVAGAAAVPMGNTSVGNVMKRIYAIITLLTLALHCAVAAVTITLPTLPEPLKEGLVTGKGYYLYNVQCGTFACCKKTDGDDLLTLDTEASGASLLSLEQQENGNYVIKTSDGKYVYIRSFYPDGTSSSYFPTVFLSSPSSYYHYKDSFAITEVSPGVYTINNSLKEEQQNRLWSGSSPVSFSYIEFYEPYDNWIFIPEEVFSDPLKLEEVRTYAAKYVLFNSINLLDERDLYVKNYEDIYNDPSATVASLSVPACNIKYDFTRYPFLYPNWSDYYVSIIDKGGWTKSTSFYDYNHFWHNNKTDTLRTGVYVDQKSTFVFTITEQEYRGLYAKLNVYVNGKLVYEYSGASGDYQIRYEKVIRDRHFVDLEPGYNVIEIEVIEPGTKAGSSTCLTSLGVEATPELSVSLTKAGTLGDEVLRAMSDDPSQQSLRSVRKLKVSGPMNNADWNDIYKMRMLFSLDLSDADITEIKDGQLSLYYHPSLEFLHELTLPKKLTKIGKEAFYSSYIGHNMDIPESVTSIGDAAFSYTRLRHANIPNVKELGREAFYQCTALEDVTMRSVENIGDNAFAYCTNLTKVTFEGRPDNVPAAMFYNCYNLENVSIPSTVTEIEMHAFDGDSKAQITALPQGLKSIGDYAFRDNASAALTLPEGLERIGKYGFYKVPLAVGNIPSTLKAVGDYGLGYFHNGWTAGKPDTLYLAPNATYGKGALSNCNVKNIVVPGTQYELPANNMLAGCDSIESITLLSPTVVAVASNFLGTHDDDVRYKQAIKVKVPQHLLYAYKRDDYWMDFTLESNGMMNTDSVAIMRDLELAAEDRFEGTPDISTGAGVLFSIDGTAGMEVKDMTLSNDLVNGKYSQLWTSSDQIHINGETSERFRTAANKWYFLALPFDCDLKRTVNESGALYAVRYYDGAQRATTDALVYPESEHSYAYGLKKSTPGNKQLFSKPGAKALRLVFSPDTRMDSYYYFDDYKRDDMICIQDANGDVTYYSGNVGAREVTLEGDYFYVWIESYANSTGSAYSYGYSFDAIYADDVLVPNMKNGNWKDYDCSSDVIKAGTGFIFMTNIDSWTRFYSVDNTTKQYVFSAADNADTERRVALQNNVSSNPSNSGWNLVGNPFSNYYNCHQISFSAPITLWNGKTYVAKSLTDDDVALKPCEAVFVQCPKDVAEIVFSALGRQTNDSIVSPSAARSMFKARLRAAVIERQLFDVALTGNNGEDRTRVVLNDMASASYEMTCDAAKFMSMDASVPQIYSLDADDTKYAINERPLNDGTVRLGTHFPKSGDYTIALARTAVDRVLLTDNETGETVNITDDEYTFAAEAGTTDSRFTLTLVPAPTSVEGVEAGDADTKVAARQIFTIDGRKVNGMNTPGTYIVRGKKGVRKVVSK